MVAPMHIWAVVGSLDCSAHLYRDTQGVCHATVFKAGRLKNSLQPQVGFVYTIVCAIIFLASCSTHAMLGWWLSPLSEVLLTFCTCIRVCLCTSWYNNDTTTAYVYIYRKHTSYYDWDNVIGVHCTTLYNNVHLQRTVTSKVNCLFRCQHTKHPRSNWVAEHCTMFQQ